MKGSLAFLLGLLVPLLAALALCFSAACVLDEVALRLMITAATAGAVGGLVYELTAMQGNFEWPHPATEGETPPEGYPLGRWKYLFDLGILARLFIGAAAAVAITWVLPVEAAKGLQFVAISLVAGSAGTAVFRSLQDRLLAALSAKTIGNLGVGLASAQGDIISLKKILSSVSASQGAGVVASAEEIAKMNTMIDQLGGKVQALLKIAGKP